MNFTPVSLLKYFIIFMLVFAFASTTSHESFSQPNDSKTKDEKNDKDTGKQENLLTKYLEKNKVYQGKDFIDAKIRIKKEFGLPTVV